jgi:cell division protein FtsN
MPEKIKYLIVSVCCLYLVGCSSGPYDLDETTINYEEKTITADTIKTVVEKIDENKEIKEDLIIQKESFHFIVQIGAFAVLSNFESFFQRAKMILGDEVYYESKNNLYKIRMGKYNNKAEALVLLDKVRSFGYSDAFIITVRTK